MRGIGALVVVILGCSVFIGGIMCGRNSGNEQADKTTAHDRRELHVVTVVATREPVEVMVVIATRPPSATPVPSATPEPTVTATFSPLPSPTNYPTATRTRRPTFTPSATLMPSATPMPSDTPTVTATAFTCGHVELVLKGAGKEHRFCHTATPGPQPTQTTMPTRTPTGTTVPTATPEKAITFGDKPLILPKDIERRVFELTNEQRTDAKVKALVWDDTIRRIAHLHSDDMHKRSYFSHYSPENDGPHERARNADYKCDQGNRYRLGENLAKVWLHLGYYVQDGERVYGPWRSMEAIADEIMKGWMNSPSHRRNILSRAYRYIGIGVVFGDEHEVLVTQNFC